MKEVKRKRGRPRKRLTLTPNKPPKVRPVSNLDLMDSYQRAREALESDPMLQQVTGPAYKWPGGIYVRVTVAR